MYLLNEFSEVIKFWAKLAKFWLSGGQKIAKIGGFGIQS